MTKSATSENQCLIMSKLSKQQYIDFLKLCKKYKLTKSEALREAVIKYWKLSGPCVKKVGFQTIDNELKELLSK